MLQQSSPPVKSPPTEPAPTPGPASNRPARPASHAAKLYKSERLQRLHHFLADGRWHTTKEIRDACDSCAVHSDIHELRMNHYWIESKRIDRIWQYRNPVANWPR